jgi:two-component system, cell cycle response regulator
VIRELVLRSDPGEAVPAGAWEYGSSTEDAPGGAVRAWQLAAVFGLSLFVLHLTFGVGGHGLDRFFNRWVYDGLELLAATGCLLRAHWVLVERKAWLVLGLGLLSFAVGDICFDFVYGGNPPSPSLADLFYLLFYPACYVAVGLLIRARISTFNRSLWLDGAMAALASAALGASVLLEVVLQNTHGSQATVLTNVAYPLGDIVLLSLIVFVFAITGWRPGGAWLMIGSAFALAAVADGIYLYQSATNTYSEGTLLDALWPAAMLLLAGSAWQRKHRPAVELQGRPLLGTPLVCGLVAIGILIDSRAQTLNLFAVGLAGATLITVLVRTALTFRENTRMLDQTRQLSMTDPLTGLANRRKLLADLERALATDSNQTRLLVIYDLNGFKRYNDTYGHPAGDGLLFRLADKLRAAIEPHGRAYRLGGDEFCVLATTRAGDAGSLLDMSATALSENSEGFTISSSFGAVFLPDEATDASAAFSIADQRLYAHKQQFQTGADSGPYEVLLRALTEREPGLREHLDGVAQLATALGTQLGLSDDELKELHLAAQLHDVGKLAIPEAVLQKPGPLTDQEWDFVKQHTLIGQRILAGAPALRAIGEIVRSTHERWDGSGYTDGLATNEIPLAARIIAVCDAYNAMTSNRAYRQALTPDQAREELERCAGSQFDPDIVHSFCQQLDALTSTQDRHDSNRSRQELTQPDHTSLTSREAVS